MHWWITLFLGFIIAYLILKFTSPMTSGYTTLRPDDFENSLIGVGLSQPKPSVMDPPPKPIALPSSAPMSNPNPPPAMTSASTPLPPAPGTMAVSAPPSAPINK